MHAWPVEDVCGGWRNRFTVSGFVVPMIARLHDHGGFVLVLGFAAVFHAIVLAYSTSFYGLTYPDAKWRPTPAE
jgi:hypothetical protein